VTFLDTTINDQIAQLSPYKRELLWWRLKGKSVEKTSAPLLPTIVPDPDNRYQPFPLTDMQQAYWIGRQSSFIQGSVPTQIYQEFEGQNLDVDLLAETWRYLIQRHDILRAIILPDGRQRILEQVAPYELKALDLRRQDDATVNAEIDHIRNQMSHQFFTLDSWPLFDVRATLLDGDRVRIHFSIDGLLIDGWSHQVLLREWFQLFKSGGHMQLPPLELSFRDYVQAIQSLRTTDLYERSLEYWQSRLQTLPPGPDLPLAVDPGGISDPRFTRRSEMLAADTWNRIKTRATRAGITPTGLLISIYGEVLATWCKSPRFSLNVPRFNRLSLHPQVNDILGEFASMSLIEIDYTASESFEVRAQRVQQQLWKAVEHQLVSGVEVLRRLAKVLRQPSLTMPVVFTCSPQPVQGIESLSITGAGTGINVEYSITPTSQVWLDHEFFEVGDTVLLNWDAVEDLFPPGTLDDMFSAYLTTIDRLATNEESWHTSRRQHVIPPYHLEQRRIGNATDAPTSERLLHELMKAHVDRNDEAPAVITTTRTLSYRELAHSSRRLGRRLRGLGAQPNTLIAIVMEKGWEQIVAVLGILHAGAAYLPLDAGMPQERLHALLEHAQATIVVTQPWLNESIVWPETTQRVCIGDHTLTGDDEPPLEPWQSADDLAYVIYTSGSTGFPKGVMISHRSVTNVVAYTNERFSIGRHDRVLSLTTLHHDLSVYDVFGVLAGGGAIVMPDEAARQDPAHWLELIQTHAVTVWNTVPTMMEMLLHYACAQSDVQIPSLRLAILGGDWIPITLPERFKLVCPDAMLLSIGGPTETTIWNIFFLVDAVDPTWTSIPYGRPIANSRYFVLNDSLEHCPTWVPGHLYCAGVGLAKGYWKDEDLTSANFFVHQLTNDRVYRTGDLGRFLPDGTIEFLGRDDFQVKVQGYRVELGEIEATLLQHPNVTAAVVTASGSQDQGKNLAAFVVLQHDVVTPAAMTDLIAQDLAEYQRDEDLQRHQAERLEFKLQQHGIRRDCNDQPSFALTLPQSSDIGQREWIERRSYRRFNLDPIPATAFGAMLRSLGQITIDGSPIPKYSYPSGGGLYPVQTYIHIKDGRVQGLPSGVYYYHPVMHHLVTLSPGIDLDRGMHALDNRAVFDASAFSIFLIADLAAIEPLYGAMARDLCWLEAGYMGQQLMMSAPTHDIGLCPLGDIRFEDVEHLFRLRDSHMLVHCLVGGAIEPWQKTPTGFIQEMALFSAMATPQARDVDHQATIDELHTYLRQKLPQHMVPVSINVLDALPLTANGKVDRKALAQKSTATAASSNSVYVAPTTPIEQTIAMLWQEVLGVDNVGVTSNFFDLGGNSLHLIQVHTKLKEVFGKDVPVMEMFNNPTISFLAMYLNDSHTEASATMATTQDRARKQREALSRQKPILRRRDVVS